MIGEKIALAIDTLNAVEKKVDDMRDKLDRLRKSLFLRSTHGIKMEEIRHFDGQQGGCGVRQRWVRFCTMRNGERMRLDPPLEPWMLPGAKVPKAKRDSNPARDQKPRVAGAKMK